MSAVVSYRGTVQPWHCDHMGHMNVMWYVGKFDEGTWVFFTTLGITPSYMRDEHRGMSAVQQNIAYRREVVAGECIEVRTTLIEIRERAIRFRHDMYVVETGEIAATCELTGVHIDRAARKSCPFPEAIRAAALRFLPG
jgi:acyl-CoA thioester hydrolase